MFKGTIVLKATEMSHVSKLDKVDAPTDKDVWKETLKINNQTLTGVVLTVTSHPKLNKIELL